MVREWTYDVIEAGNSLAEFVDPPIYYEDVLELIHSWIPEDIQEPHDNNLPSLQEIYMTDDTAQK